MLGISLYRSCCIVYLCTGLCWDSSLSLNYYPISALPDAQRDITTINVCWKLITRLSTHNPIQDVNYVAWDDEQKNNKCVMNYFSSPLLLHVRLIDLILQCISSAVGRPSLQALHTKRTYLRYCNFKSYGFPYLIWSYLRSLLLPHKPCISFLYCEVAFRGFVPH
jgi:hypothetical protein